MSTRVVSVEYVGRFKVSIRKEQFGREAMFWYRLEDGFWWQDGGPYETEKAAREQALVAIGKVTVGVVRQG